MHTEFPNQGTSAFRVRAHRATGLEHIGVPLERSNTQSSGPELKGFNDLGVQTLEHIRPWRLVINELL